MKDFETKLERLESLARDIKREDIKIEDAIKDFEEGIKLARGMAQEIDAIEGKIQILMNNPLEEENKGQAAADSGQETEENEEQDASTGADGEKDAKTTSGKKTATGKAKKITRHSVMPELSLFAGADGETGTSGEPSGGTRQ